MAVPTIFDTCRPREDILRGAVADADFAADLASVVNRRGSPAYVDPARFFANTYPTRGLRNLLSNVCRRLSGAGEEAAYWLGMAMHRRRPRRVLAAFRLLLTEAAR